LETSPPSECEFDTETRSIIVCLQQGSVVLYPVKEIKMIDYTCSEMNSGKYVSA